MARVSWRDLATTLGPFILLLVAAFAVALHFIHPAPPRTVVMSAGRPGTVFQATAERYRAILARQGVKLEIVPSEGSIENLHRLADPSSRVDVAFVQGGLARLGEPDKVVSLGSISYSPIAVFYRAPRAIERLSQLAGKRIAIGREGSGTRAIAETLLEANGIRPGGSTTLVDLEGKDAADALTKGSVDAAFLMGDSASGANMMQLVHAPGVRLFDFVQADAYVRRFNYLSRIELPAGSLDLGRNEPPQPIAIVAATVELLARPDLHPAISDMLIEAAREVNGRATLLQKAGEFPAPLPHEYRLSDDALRYYKSGKGLAYRLLPFWLASLVDRIVILLVPVLVVLLPGLKLVPMLYTWRVRERIYRRYGQLMAIERAAFEHTTAEQRAQLLKRLDEFEEHVIKMRLPSWWADELYVLRNHIAFVRRRLEGQMGG
jgi:TRAP transporter TAXI family solute receptor